MTPAFRISIPLFILHIHRGVEHIFLQRNKHTHTRTTFICYLTFAIVLRVTAVAARIEPIPCLPTINNRIFERAERGILESRHNPTASYINRGNYPSAAQLWWSYRFKLNHRGPAFGMLTNMRYAAYTHTSKPRIRYNTTSTSWTNLNLSSQISKFSSCTW